MTIMKLSINEILSLILDIFITDLFNFIRPIYLNFVIKCHPSIEYGMDNVYICILMMK